MHNRSTVKNIVTRNDLAVAQEFSGHVLRCLARKPLEEVEGRFSVRVRRNYFTVHDRILRKGFRCARNGREQRWLSRWFEWRNALAVVVTPKTFIGWHRKGFQLFWHWKCQSGRPRLPPYLQHLIRQMARDNPSWGEERMANELRLKLGLCVSPRTLRKYLPKLPTAPVGKPRADQRWSTFLKNHAQTIIACDFCVVATVTFRILYVFVVMEHLSRRIIHANVTAHPTAAWTLQQLREAIPSDHPYSFIIHDAIFSTGLDVSVAGLGFEGKCCNFENGDGPQTRAISHCAPENAATARLLGGERGIRTLGTA